MKLTRRGFLAGAGAVAVGSAAWGLDPNRAWADEEAAEEAAGTDEAPAEEPAAPAGPVVVCEECPGACTLVLDVEDGRVAAVHGDGANPFSEGRLCLRAQALTDLWKAPEGTTEDDADDDSGNGAGGNDAASEGATTASPGRLTSPRVRRAGSDAWEDISWDRALDEIANARWRGQKVFVETCPQYLVLDDSVYYNEDWLQAAKYVCSPPIRKPADREALWRAIRRGEVQTVSTDHCSFTTQQKLAGRDDFTAIPGGIPGVETRGELIYTFGVAKKKIGLGAMCRVLAENPAKLYGLFPRKGVLAPGSDADIVVYDPNADHVIHAEDMVGAADYNPYEGVVTKGSIRQVWLRGKPAVSSGKVLAGPDGKYLPRGKCQL